MKQVQKLATQAIRIEFPNSTNAIRQVDRRGKRGRSPTERPQTTASKGRKLPGSTASGQISTSYGTEDGRNADSDDDPDSDGGVSVKTSSTVAAYEKEVPIWFSAAGNAVGDEGRKRQCFLCLSLASDPSPLNGATKDDQFGGHLPWNSYDKVKDKNGKTIAKIPKGLTCSPCINVFFGIGYNLKYCGGKKSLTLYKNVMKTPAGIDIHKNFLGSCKVWFKQQNDEIDVSGRTWKGRKKGSTMKSKEDLTKVHKVLETAKVRTAGFKAPKKFFVSKDAWDKDLDGVWDETRARELLLFGNLVKGCYMLSSPVYTERARDGVYECKDEEIAEIREITREEDGDDMLTAQGIATKADFIVGKLDDQTKLRAATAMEAPKHQEYLHDMMLKMCGSEKGPGAGSDKAALPDQEVITKTGHEDSSESESESGEDTTAARFSAILGLSSKPSASGQKTAASGQKTAGSVQKTPASGQRASGSRVAPASTASSSVGRPSSAASGQITTVVGSAASDQTKAAVATTMQQTLRLDGRTDKLRENATAFLQTAKETLDNLTFESSQTQAFLRGDALAAFQIEQKEVQQSLAAMKIKLNSLMTRVSQSSNKANLAVAEQALTQLKQKIEILIEFVEFMKGSKASLEQGLAACKAVIDFGYKLSKHYHLKICDGKFQQKNVHGDHAGICEMMSPTSSEVQLLETCCSKAEIASYLEMKCSGFVIEILTSAMKKSKKAAAASGQKHVCESEAGKEAAISLKWYAAHAAQTLRRSAEIAYYFMTSRDVGVICVRDAVGLMETYQADGDRKMCPIKEFLIGPGVAIFNEASAILACRAGEVDNEQKIAKMIESAEDLIEGPDAFREVEDQEDGQPRGDSLREQVDALECESKTKEDSFHEFIEGACAWLREFDAALKRKKKANPFNARQTHELQLYKKEIVAVLETELHKIIGDTVFLCISDACTAMKQDGYVTGKCGMQSALGMGALLEDLAMKKVMDHDVWKIISSEQIEKHRINCKTLGQVMSHVLEHTTAQKALNFLTEETVGEVDSVDLIEFYLEGFVERKRDNETGCDEDTIRTFVECFVRPFEEMAAGLYVEGSKMFRTLIAECKGDKFGGIDSEAVRKLMVLVPDTHPGRPVVFRFFQVLMDYKELVFADGKKLPKQSCLNALKQDIDDLLATLNKSKLSYSLCDDLAAASGQTPGFLTPGKDDITAASGQTTPTEGAMADTGLTETVPELDTGMEDLKGLGMGVDLGSVKAKIAEVESSEFPPTQLAEGLPETQTVQNNEDSLQIVSVRGPQPLASSWPAPKKAKLTAEEKTSQSLETFGLHDEDFLAFVKVMANKVAGIAGTTMETNGVKLAAAVDAVNARLKSIPIVKEHKFRAAMKEQAHVLNRQNHEIQAIIDELEAASGQTPELTAALERAGQKNVVVEARTVRQRILEYSSMYVAMTLLSNEDCTSEKLTKVVEAWRSATAAQTNPIFPDVAAQMQGGSPNSGVPESTASASSPAPAAAAADDDDDDAPLAEPQAKKRRKRRSAVEK